MVIDGGASTAINYLDGEEKLKVEKIDRKR